MKKLTIGIDPDSAKHGVAIYDHKTLIDLKQFTLVEIMEFIQLSKDESYELLFSIEDVKANKFIYSRNVKSNSSVQSKIAISVGACQQSQEELMRLLDHLHVKYVKHKPQRGNWAKNRQQFEKVTGWKGRSNKDTRSAAYFGYLAA